MIAIREDNVKEVKLTPEDEAAYERNGKRLLKSAQQILRQD